MATDTEFSIRGIGELDDGYTALMVDRHLREAVADCYDRPGDESARTVVLRLHLRPQAQGSHCVGVSVEAEIGPLKRPSVKCPAVGMRIGHGSRLLYNPVAPDAPDQLTLDQAQG